MAWEVNARVAIAERDLGRVKSYIVNGLATIEGFEVPLAAWRVHATAASIGELAGSKESANHHRKLSHTTIQQLADSLPAEHKLRKTFASAPSISKIVWNAEASQICPPRYTSGGIAMTCWSYRVINL